MERQWKWLTIQPQHVPCECAYIKGQTHSPELRKSNHIVLDPWETALSVHTVCYHVTPAGENPLKTQ